MITTELSALAGALFVLLAGANVWLMFMRLGSVRSGPSAARLTQAHRASGYLYLETVTIQPAIAFPPEQAEHPGWRATATSGSGLPAGAFIWIGERAAPELAIIRRLRRVDPLYINARAVIARVR